MKQNHNIPNKIIQTLFVASFVFLNFIPVFAQGTLGIDPNTDPTKSSFKVIVCDGPAAPAGPNHDAIALRLAKSAGKQSYNDYVPCDFTGLMIQIQHLINIFMVLGVLAAILLFTYAGYLLMTGKPADHSKALDIFPKIFVGFIIMLAAWAIVYELVSVLTGNNPIFTKLLGK